LKRLSITRGFLVIIIIAAILLGALFAFILINPNVLGLLSSGDQITISRDDYTTLVDNYNKYRKVSRVWNTLDTSFYKDFDESKLEDSMISGLVAGLGDKYSSYYSAEEYEEISASLTGEYSGVGMTMSATDDNYIEVVAVTRNSPAERGGVTVGEYIIAVDGVSYSGEDMDTCAANIRGAKGTSVKVTFLKDGEKIERNFTREEILTESVEYEILDDNVGYIWLYSFTAGTYDDFLEALTAVKDCDSLVLDLRDNNGGFVETAQDIADLFMDKAALFYTENRAGEREYWYTNNGITFDKPVVLIINEYTASAAEILTAGLRDNERVVVVGTTSYGKGVIQSVENLGDGSALKLTMWQYFSPNGNAINEKGVNPDFEVELSDDCFDEEGYLINDLQLNKALEILK